MKVTTNVDSRPSAHMKSSLVESNYTEEFKHGDQSDRPILSGNESDDSDVKHWE